ncbi:hypothetical protein F9K91_10580 [Brucella tritici]|uniref:Uncharacterized protein n=1 Tax=Brucella tritici TaxID=94626 RepID=A0A833CM46_9HYPH|nr:hypothetical protein [Brucella tritici]KAB2665172.1 hypothetical protein F9K91_10580 [Brucella tritici]
MTSIASLVDAFIAKQGAPTKFEPGVGSNFDFYASYLSTFGIQLRQFGWRYQLSQSGGPWRDVSRGAILKLVNTFRAMEGLPMLQVGRR